MSIQASIKLIVAAAGSVGAVAWGFGAQLAAQVQPPYTLRVDFWIGALSFVGGVAVNLIIVGIVFGDFRQWRRQVDSERSERSGLVSRLIVTESKVEHHDEEIASIKQAIVEEIRSVRTDVMTAVQNMRPVIVDRRGKPRE